jgi:hypothetical protein
MRDSDNPVPQILHLEQTIRLCSLGEAISQGMLPAGEDTNGADADISGIIIDLDGPPSQTYPRGSAGALLQRAWQDYLGQTGGDGISFRRISIGFRRNQEAEVQLVRELTRILATMCINILQVDTERDIQVLSPLSDIGPALQASLRDAMRATAPAPDRACDLGPRINAAGPSPTAASRNAEYTDFTGNRKGAQYEHSSKIRSFPASLP